MSEENVEIMRRGFEYFQETGDFRPEIIDPEFVWDMSTFRGWPEQQTYAGLEGARQFMAEWRSAWEDWELTVESLHDAGDKVVAVMRQHGRAKATGLPIDMAFAMVFTLRDGKQIRMQMYSDPAEALAAAGLPA
jgi:ketosteroid isomerase-like protein